MNERATTLRARLRLVLAIAALLFAAGATVTLFALGNLDEDTKELTDRSTPARLFAENLRVAYLDQETGVRGFTISREGALLAPYESGQRAESAAVTSIRRLQPSAEVTAQLAAVSDAAQAWRTGFAEVSIELAGDTPRARPLTVDQDRGRVLFDELRLRLGELTEQLAAERVEARERLADGLTRLIVLTVLTFALLVVAGAALWLALRRFVLAPVDKLAAETRTVADGEFDHRVDVAGPAEIQALGTDIETMRVRIVATLAASRTAEAEVRAQAAALASQTEELAAQTEELAAQTEELRRSNDELEQFAYVASHDLQEPLRKVASFCQMLQRRYSGQLDERADQYIEFAVDGAKRMQQLINDLLAFSRVGRTSEAMAAVDCTAAAERALSALSTVRDESGAHVEIGKLPTVHADESLLTQLFQNLVGNAIKFRAPGRTAHVRLNAQREDEWWHFTCADNGIGIEPEYAERVFVIFQRLHPKDQYVGTGIGLSLCKKIVEYHGGRIWLDTERLPGTQGTVVHWTLPADVPEGVSST